MDPRGWFPSYKNLGRLPNMNMGYDQALQRHELDEELRAGMAQLHSQRLNAGRNQPMLDQPSQWNRTIPQEIPPIPDMGFLEWLLKSFSMDGVGRGRGSVVNPLNQVRRFDHGLERLNRGNFDNRYLELLMEMNRQQGRTRTY